MTPHHLSYRGEGGCRGGRVELEGRKSRIHTGFKPKFRDEMAFFFYAETTKLTSVAQVFFFFLYQRDVCSQDLDISLHKNDSFKEQENFPSKLWIR